MMDNFPGSSPRTTHPFPSSFPSPSSDAPSSDDMYRASDDPDSYANRIACRAAAAAQSPQAQATPGADDPQRPQRPQRPGRRPRDVHRAPPLHFGPQTIVDRTFHILYHALRRARSSVANADILDSLFPGQNQQIERFTMHPINEMPTDGYNESLDQYINDDEYDEQNNIFINEIPSAMNDIHDIFTLTHESPATSESMNMCMDANIIPTPLPDNVASQSDSPVSTILTASSVSTILTASGMTERRDSRPQLSVRLPNRPTQPSITFLLDTGSDLNVLNVATAR